MTKTISKCMRAREDGDKLCAALTIHIIDLCNLYNNLSLMMHQDVTVEAILAVTIQWIRESGAARQ